MGPKMCDINKSDIDTNIDWKVNSMTEYITNIYIKEKNKILVDIFFTISEYVNTR